MTFHHLISCPVSSSPEKLDSVPLKIIEAKSSWRRNLRLPSAKVDMHLYIVSMIQGSAGSEESPMEIVDRDIFSLKC